MLIRPILRHNKSNLQQTNNYFKLKTESFEAIPLKSGTRQECPLSPFLFNVVFKVLAIAIRQQKDIKGLKIGKEEFKVALFVDDMIVYISSTKNSSREL